MGNKKEDRFNRGARKYIEGAVKAASHPVRDQILRSLKNGPLTAVDLEEMLGMSRYNLYHHPWSYEEHASVPQEHPYRIQL